MSGHSGCCETLDQDGEYDQIEDGPHSPCRACSCAGTKECEPGDLLGVTEELGFA